MNCIAKCFLATAVVSYASVPTILTVANVTPLDRWGFGWILSPLLVPSLLTFMFGVSVLTRTVIISVVHFHRMSHAKTNGQRPYDHFMAVYSPYHEVQYDRNDRRDRRADPLAEAMLRDKTKPQKVAHQNRIKQYLD